MHPLRCPPDSFLELRYESLRHSRVLVCFIGRLAGGFQSLCVLFGPLRGLEDSGLCGSTGCHGDWWKEGVERAGESEEDLKSHFTIVG